MENGGERQPKRVIAVVADAFAPFHRDVIESIRPHFTAAGYGTLGVAGRDVRTDRMLETSTGDAARYRGAFGTQLGVCGAIVVCGATPPTMSDDAIAAYVAELTDGPVVSLGIRLPNVPSVEIDWPTGIDALMEHVLAVPGAMRFAFVRGFPGDPHSEMREAGFRRALEAAGRTVHESLIVNGNFSMADARNAVARLIDNGESFDVVVAANDDMAVGAMSAITVRGLSVPEDVIVAGFDNALCSVTSEPPLTTVLLDTPALTAASARLVLDAVEGRVQLTPDTVVQIGSELIVRQSSNWFAGHPQSDEFLDRLIERWETDWAPSGVDVEQLAGLASRTLRSGDGHFLHEFGRLARSAAYSPNRVDVVWLRHAWRELHAAVAEVDGEREGLLSMLGQLAAIDRTLQPTEARHRTEVMTHRELQERLVMRIAACPDPPTLWRTLRSGLRSLGMQNAWVVTHVSLSNGSVDPDERLMQLVFSLAREDLSTIETFDASEILPPRVAGILESDLHVLVPLRAGDSDIGYMVIEPRGDHLLELEAIALGVAQVLRHVRQVADLEGQASRLHLANEALDRLASQDTLTGLANRKRFLERLQTHITEIENGDQRHLAVLFLDLDGFKQINDTLGHAAGDQLLRILASRLDEAMEATDTLARLGGDEFTMLIVDDDNCDRVIDVAEHALRVAAEPAVVAGQQINVSASLGVASYPDDGSTASDLLRNADIAMYAAKEAGRNRFESYCELRDIEASDDADIGRAPSYLS